MPTTTILFGIALIGYGLYLYFERNPDKSQTALIPAFFGAAFLVLGAIGALKESLRKHVMHLAAAIGLFGCISGLGMGLPKLETFSGQPAARPEAVKAQILLGVVCGVYMLLCIKSFIDARAARKKARQGTPAVEGRQHLC